MPRAKGNVVAKKPAKKAPVTSHPLCAPLPEGTVLRDVLKREWKIGRHIGKGGFGIIYAARRVGGDDHNDYVIKIEPMSNGPLFCEVHFYQRVAKSELIENWKKEKKMKSLGMPRYIVFGNHQHSGQECRFLVMEQFGEDLQNIFERLNKRFQPITVFTVGMKVIDTLEYIHQAGYAHADIKAANLLRGLGSSSNEVYLVDFGLVYRYSVNGQKQPEREDPKRRHDGTLEFCSRDAHRGVSPSPRGDLEILGYCMLQWLGGRLPWQSLLGNTEADKQAVANMKEKFMKDVKTLATQCQAGDMPDFIKFLELITKLRYTDTPDYGKLKQLLLSSIQRLDGKPKTPKLVFENAPLPSAAAHKPAASSARGRKRGAENNIGTEAKRKSVEDKDVIPAVDYKPDNNSAKDKKIISSPADAIKSPLKPANSASPLPGVRASPRIAAKARDSPRASPLSISGTVNSPASARKKGASVTSPIIPAAATSNGRQSAGIQTSPELFRQYKQQRRQQKSAKTKKNELTM